MNNAAFIGQRIVNTRGLSLLEQLILSSKGETYTPAPKCETPASEGAHCAGTGETLSTYLAPEQKVWSSDYISPDGYETTRHYYRRCR